MKLLPLIIGIALAAPAGAEILALPFPDLPVAKGGTVVWSPLFQATWDQMNQPTGKPVSVNPPNKLMERLDSFQWDAAKVMPEGSWKTWSGPATPEFLAKVNGEARNFTADKTGPFKATSPLPGAIAAFGILDRTVTFEKELSRSRQLPLKFTSGAGAADVAFFGTKADETTPGIRILSLNQPERSHAIQMLCKEGDDTVILFLPPRPLDFSTACRWIRTWAAPPPGNLEGKWDDPWIHAGDEIRVPYLTLESDAEFAPQLQGVRHFAKGGPLELVQASQLTRFQLHEKGATVHSEVTLMAEPFAGGDHAPPPIPRKFIYDRPFFVFLWRKGAQWPYFGAWIGNTDAMEPFAHR